MNKLFKIFILFTFCSLAVSAQTLEEAKALFLDKQYGKALPAFKKYVNLQPTNPSLNYWYGVCLLKTGEAKASIKHLNFANRYKIADAPLSLGEANELLYRFSNALIYYNTYRTNLVNKKLPTKDIDNLITHCKNGQNMLQGIEKVCIIDSFVVDKTGFLNTYKLDSECGKLYMYNDFFHNTTNNNNSTVYETERGNRIYYGEATSEGNINLFTRIKTTDSWSTPTPLPSNINNATLVNYPYLSDDGVTIYYASNSTESMGGYDLFVTRYDTNTDTYLNPENMGMPFNSPYNDYMLAIDNINNLGWFASDRYQLSDKVCIYVFVPNSTKQIYDSKSILPDKLISLGQLHCIKDTWIDKVKVEDAINRFNNIKQHSEQTISEKQKEDFDFVIDDTHIYHQYNNFHSPKALQEFKIYISKAKEVKHINVHLDDLRHQYNTLSADDKKKIAPTILNLENKSELSEDTLYNYVKNIRKLEINELYKK